MHSIRSSADLDRLLGGVLDPAWHTLLAMFRDQLLDGDSFDFRQSGSLRWLEQPGSPAAAVPQSLREGALVFGTAILPALKT